MVKYRVAVFFILSLFLHGCAYTPDNWAFDEEVLDKDALTKIKRVALLDMPPPSKIWLGDPSGGGTAVFFLGPVLALGADTHSSDNPASSAFFSETTQKELKIWLEQAGMEVILLKAKRGEKPKFLHDYSQFEQVDADVILEVVPIFMGFRHDTSTMDFTKGELSPEVTYAYRVVSAKNKDLLAESNVFHSSFYHYHRSYFAGIKLIGPEEHLFEDEDDVKAHPEEALRRLQYAIKEATKTISEVVTNTYEEPSVKSVAFTGDFSGRYRSEITYTKIAANSQARNYFGKHPYIEVKIEHSENKINGDLVGSRSGELTGVVDGNRIDFEFFMKVPGSSAKEGNGVWILDNVSGVITGTWDIYYGPYHSAGEWKLLKVE